MLQWFIEFIKINVNNAAEILRSHEWGHQTVHISMNTNRLFQKNTRGGKKKENLTQHNRRRFIFTKAPPCVGDNDINEPLDKCVG